MDIKTLLSKLAQSRIAEAQATAARLKIEQQIVEFRGVYDTSVTSIMDSIMGLPEKKEGAQPIDIKLCEEKILGHIIESGESGIAKWRLTRLTQYLSAGDRGRIMDSLERDGKIAKRLENSKTKPFTVYTYNLN